MILQDIVFQLDRYMPDSHIEVEDVPQNINENTFLVRIINTELNREFRNRYWYSLLFNITYIPARKTDQFELEKVRTGLLFVLDEVPLGDGGTARARNLTDVMQEQAVVITASYDLYLKKHIEPDVLMQHLYQEWRTKGALDE